MGAWRIAFRRAHYSTKRGESRGSSALFTVPSQYDPLGQLAVRRPAEVGQKMRGVDIEGRVLDETEGGGADVGQAGGVPGGRAAHGEEAQKRIDRADGHVFRAQVLRAVLKGEAREEHVVDEQMLEEDVPAGEARFELLLRREIAFERAPAAVETGERFLTVGAHASAPLVDETDEHLRRVEPLLEVRAGDLRQGGRIVKADGKPARKRRGPRFHGPFQCDELLFERRETLRQGQPAVLHDADELQPDLPLVTVGVEKEPAFRKRRQSDGQLTVDERERFLAAEKKLRHGLAAVGAGDLIAVLLPADAARVEAAHVGERSLAELGVDGTAPVREAHGAFALIRRHELRVAVGRRLENGTDTAVEPLAQGGTAVLVDEPEIILEREGHRPAAAAGAAAGTHLAGERRDIVRHTEDMRFRKKVIFFHAE